MAFSKVPHAGPAPAGETVPETATFGGPNAKVLLETTVRLMANGKGLPPDSEEARWATVDRAYALAQTGHFAKLNAIKARLEQEGHKNVLTAPRSSLVQRELRALCRSVATSKPDLDRGAWLTSTPFQRTNACALKGPRAILGTVPQAPFGSSAIKLWRSRLPYRHSGHRHPKHLLLGPTERLA